MKVLPLYDRNDNLLDYALIDDDDFDRTEKYKWRRESYERKDREPRQYAFARVEGIRMRLHQLILGKPDADEDVIDHISHDGLDNRKNNLRIVSGRLNAQNALKPGESASKFIGVSRKNDDWFAYCAGTYLGHFETEKACAISHDRAAIMIYGPQALTNGFQDEPQPKRIRERSDRDLPLGVTKIERKTKQFLTQCNGRYVGTYDNADAAHDAYVLAKLRHDAERQARILALPIARNSDGVAVIYLYSKTGEIKNECLVDNESWHDLMMHRWHLTGQYACSRIDGRDIQMHNYLLKSAWIDHKNGNKMDNRNKNLCKTTRSGNSQNVRRFSKNVPEYQGVYRSRAGTRYEAAIIHQGIQYYLGSFKFKESAALAYNEKALELFENPKLNIVDESAIDQSDNNVKVRKGTSRFRGVSSHKNRWTAFAQKDGDYIQSTGHFSEEEAGITYNHLAAEMFGSKARLNDITLGEAKKARIEGIFKFLEGKGVSRNRKKYVAKIQKEGKVHRLGPFCTYDDAHEAYIRKWMELFYTEYDERLPGWSLEKALNTTEAIYA